ncbi:radical SAM protein, partial [Staphylococcus epidermidis]
DEVIDAIGNSNKVVRHLHIPLQSGSDDVLKRMRRKYTMAHFSERLTKLHQALPDLAVTSDVIVGFPGESEDEFQETYDFIVNHHFSELHVFPYSPRIGTPAARMDNQIDEETKNVRVHKLISLSNQLAKEYASKFEDEVLEVIPEEMGEEPHTLVGYADNYMKVRFEGDDSLIGQIVKVKIVKANYPINEGKAIRVVKHATNQSEKEVLV